MPSTHDSHAPLANSYMTAFNAEARKELRDEDSQAWTAIVALLLGIISTGVLLAIVCVFLTTRYMT
jgi:hypothetical protein